MTTTAGPRTNWAGNIAFAAPDFYHPASVGELRTVVARARQLRVLGTGHSFNDLADSPGAQVSLAGLPPEVEIDSAASLVRVAAGLSYASVAGRLDRHGFALRNLASLPHISVAGQAGVAQARGHPDQRGGRVDLHLGRQPGQADLGAGRVGDVVEGVAGAQHPDLAGARHDRPQLAGRGRAVEVRCGERDVARPVGTRAQLGIHVHACHPTRFASFPEVPGARIRKGPSVTPASSLTPTPPAWADHGG